MRTLLVGVMVVVVTLMGVRPASADGTCEELHCYCSSGEVVVPCDADCDDVCGSSSSSTSQSAGPSKGMRTAAFVVLAVGALVILAILFARTFEDDGTIGFAGSTSLLPELDSCEAPSGGLTLRF